MISIDVPENNVIDQLAKKAIKKVMGLQFFKQAKRSTMAGFEPTRGNPNRFRICRLNPSATLSLDCTDLRLYSVDNFIV